MRRIKVGQIGIGHNHAAGKMQAVRAFPDVFEIVGYAEANPDWITERAGLEVYNGLERMSVDELLDTDGLDAVLVETDVWDLVPTAQRCIDAGVHIHMDKPAGEDITEYERTLRDAERRNLVVQLGYMYRYNPAVQYCVDAVKNGTLGEVFAIDSAMSTEHPPEYRNWLRRFRGGTMYIFGCHLIDLILSLLGRPDRIVPFQKKTYWNQIDVYDNGLAVLEYPRCTATVRINSTEVNGYGRRQFVVCGSEGTIEIKPLEGPTVLAVTLTEYSVPYQDARRIVDLPPTGGRYDEMMLDLAGMVRGEKANPYGYDHELLVQKATLKACGFDLDW